MKHSNNGGGGGKQHFEGGISPSCASKQSLTVIDFTVSVLRQLQVAKESQLLHLLLTSLETHHKSN